MKQEIRDKVVIVTGASSGIGRATSLALARRGARLALVARRQAHLIQLQQDIQKFGASAEILVLDLQLASNVKAMIEFVYESFGRIDVLINNAGFGYFGTVEETTPAIAREIFELNFEAPVLASQLVIPIMRAQKSGHIINVSSIAGKRGLPLSGIYCATKFALNGITEAMRIEVHSAGIHVSLINAAATDTEFRDHVRHMNAVRQFKPIGRVQAAEEVAAAILRCVERPKAEVYPLLESRFVVWVNAIAPVLLDRLMLRYLKERLRLTS
jgi:short-subunit dehydrogenase